eukprot:2306323-Rhodomonas_salina.2
MGALCVAPFEQCLGYQGVSAGRATRQHGVRADCRRMMQDAVALISAGDTTNTSRRNSMRLRRAQPWQQNRRRTRFGTDASRRRGCA